MPISQHSRSSMVSCSPRPIPTSRVSRKSVGRTRSLRRDELEALGQELSPFLSGKGMLRFTAENPMPASLVKRIVKIRIEEDAELRVV